MLSIFAESAEVKISQDGKRLWVTTETGTQLRIKLTGDECITLDDERISGSHHEA